MRRSRWKTNYELRNNYNFSLSLIFVDFIRQSITTLLLFISLRKTLSTQRILDTKLTLLLLFISARKTYHLSTQLISFSQRWSVIHAFCICCKNVKSLTKSSSIKCAVEWGNLVGICCHPVFFLEIFHNHKYLPWYIFVYLSVTDTILSTCKM